MKSKIFLQLIIFCFACFSEPAAAAGKITASEAEVWANQKGRQPAEKFLVGFRIHKVGGKLKIIDLKLAESSLILSYRGRFYEMLRRNDDEIEWFLEDLELITSSAEQQNQMTLTGQNL